MNICITVGHSILKSGSCTSADGRKYNGVLEYVWCKHFSRDLKKELKRHGHNVTRVVCPEKQFLTYREERPYKLNIVNNGHFDLLVELHLNASDDPGANGTEVLYKSEAGKKYAMEIQKELARLYVDRGAKKRDNLYILNQTKPVAVLIETFFCTNEADYQQAKGKKKRKIIAECVANGIERGRFL